jgi:Amino acid permease
MAAGFSITIERGSHSGWSFALKSRSDLTWKNGFSASAPLLGPLRRRQAGAGVEQAPPRGSSRAAAGEARDPQRTVPIGLLATVLISTVLYAAIGLVLAGLVPYTQLNVSDPLSVALQRAGTDLGRLDDAVNIAAVVGLASTVMILLPSAPGSAWWSGWRSG